ncbi:hypothetical protein [Burkholderia vietnamiensis]|uniref:hypothetical protein n=1 Tax=Burkholderia vietnamiensis TaxID=60552 RepID=UPI00158CE797|nr:hypothetical protein [Burkholderia vietnamiensis]MBH9648124.1 hypothetical protein [Burkholderia vietnamiensis]MBR8010022.1 hypothetical protein [Burkholderia vietnamiensis]
MTTLPILLEEAFRLRESPPEETESFDWTHDRLCEVVNRKINVLGESFLKYHHINYIVQGPRDQGVDVLIKLRNEDLPEKYIGIQAKSYFELDDRKSDLSKNLKSGYFDAKSHYGDSLERYYILLCADSKKHSKRISAINAEFSKTPDARIIQPRYLHAFVTMPDATISALADRYLSSEDYVRASALKETQEYNKPNLMFLLACLTWAFENNSDQLPTDFFNTNHHISEIEDKYGNKSLERAFGLFHDTSLETYAMEGTTRIRIEDYPAIRALYFDIQVRYNETPDELFDHLFDFLSL